MRMCFRPIFAAAVFLTGQPLFASIEPVSPIRGETVRLLPAAQRELFALSSYSSRVERLKEKWIGKAAKGSEDQWGKSRPLVLRWRVIMPGKTLADIKKEALPLPA